MSEHFNDLFQLSEHNSNKNNNSNKMVSSNGALTL